MSLPITFHRAASAEFTEASAWYETKRFGLALEFMAEIDRCVSLASKHPLQFAVVREDIRRVVANRFPYSERSPDEMQCNPGHFRIRPLLPRIPLRFIRATGQKRLATLHKPQLKGPGSH